MTIYRLAATLQTLSIICRSTGFPVSPNIYSTHDSELRQIEVPGSMFRPLPRSCSMHSE